MKKIFRKRASMLAITLALIVSGVAVNSSPASAGNLVIGSYQAGACKYTILIGQTWDGKGKPPFRNDVTAITFPAENVASCTDFSVRLRYSDKRFMNQTTDVNTVNGIGTAVVRIGGLGINPISATGCATDKFSGTHCSTLTFS